MESSPMTNEARELAKRLTNRGKEALDWVRPCSQIALYRKGACEIENLGLVSRSGTWFDITPLGREVRAILQAESAER
jgi:hypothetical protein